MPDNIDARSFQSASWLDPCDKKSTVEPVGQTAPKHLEEATMRIPSKIDCGDERASHRSFKIVSDEEAGSDSCGDVGQSSKNPRSHGLTPEIILSHSFESLFTQSKAYPGDNFLILMKIMMTVFEGKEISDSCLLFATESELSLLSSFVQKKCKVAFEPADSKQKIAELINSHKTAYKHKRNEENYKLVFKKAIKFMTKKLKADLPEIARDRTKLLLAFYHKYFKREFEKAGIEKSLDLHVSNKDKLAENFCSKIYNPKTVNPKYISTVAHSKTFIEDIVTYLNNSFFPEYTKSRYYKLERILNSCKDTIGCSQENILRLKQNIQNNPRFKLPWYDDELKKAMVCVKNYLEMRCHVAKENFSF